MTRTSKTRHALLGWLSVKPLSGYALKKRIEESTSFFWSESYGQIYPELARLEEQGLVISHEEQGEGQGPGIRRVYSITPAGFAELKRWLAEPPSPEVLRDEFLLKMFFGAHLEQDKMLEHVDRKIAELREYEQQLRETARWLLHCCEGATAHVPHWVFTIRYGVAHASGIRKELVALRSDLAQGAPLAGHLKWLSDGTDVKE